MGEDMTMMMVMACAGKVGKVDGYLYHYIRYRGGSITSGYSEKHLRQLEHNVGRVSEFLAMRFGNKYERDIAYMKLGIKSVFLVSGTSRRFFRAWRELFPEANRYAGQNPRAIKRIAMLEKCAAKNFYPAVWLFNLLVVNGYNGLRRRLTGNRRKD